MKKQFLVLFAFISVLALSQVPQRFNKVIVTGDITSPKFIKTGSTADSVLLGNGSARAISAIKTDTVNLSNRINAKATGNGTANGTNTGDETLTSIKTKLGAATSVSDGYLKYQDWSIFNSKEPAFSKNTAFNKNFGTTTGTVLEGRTFGTAAGSAVGDFQPIENQRLSTTNSPSFNRLTSTVSTGIAPFTVNSTTMVGNLTSQYLGGNNYTSPDLNTLSSLGRFSVMQVMTTSANIFPYTSNANAVMTIDTFDGSETYKQQLGFNGVGDIYSRYGNNSWSKLYHSGNLTNYLSTNYIPKWNGSSFVNSLISDDGIYIYHTSSNPGIIQNSQSLGGGSMQFKNHNVQKWNMTCQAYSYDLGFYNASISNFALNLKYADGSVSINSTTPSTLPTNGALVVNGGIGADHVRANNFYGNGSNLTGVQLPITLTTNGTSGAATFSGNVLNVPNYTSSGGVNQTQTTVNGSNSGNMVCSMPFQTGSYKKVVIYLNSMNGSATYTFPTPFSKIPGVGILRNIGIASHSTSTASITITCASSAGWCTVEGY